MQPISQTATFEGVPSQSSNIAFSQSQQSTISEINFSPHVTAAGVGAVNKGTKRAGAKGRFVSSRYMQKKPKN